MSCRHSQFCQGEDGTSVGLIFVEEHSGTVLVCRKDKDVGIGAQGLEGLAFKGVQFAIGGEGFGEAGLKDYQEDMEAGLMK